MTLSMRLGARAHCVPFLLVVVLLPVLPACRAAEGEDDVVSAMALPTARKVRSLSLRRGAAPAASLSLAQAQAELGPARQHSRAAATAKQPKSAGWFGDFSQMESTYHEDGDSAYLDQDPERTVEFGFDLGYKSPYKDAGAKKSEWFDESPSAGTKDAWQTHYPAPGATGTWRNTFEGWVENYAPSRLTTEHSSGPGPNPAEWFDSSVLNYDGFGRKKLPYPGSGQRLYATDADGASFVERAMNTTIACAGHNCTASTLLQAFDASSEEGRNCHLSIGVHATDFDNDWSKEAIKDWTVNGYLVRAVCDPMARGCNNSAWRPLYSCLNGMSVDHIIDETGALSISGRISKFVDECPYNGNLLSGVVMVTCMVRPIPPVKSVAEPQWKEKSVVQMGATVATGSSKLRCAHQGCTAETVIEVDPQVAMSGGTCLMNISMVQTDFDDTENELLEFLKLGREGVSLSLSSKPDANPCNLQYAGTPLSEEKRAPVLLTNYNVTAEVLAAPVGKVLLSGKITDAVDECASEGFLLDATATIRCELPEGSAPELPALLQHAKIHGHTSEVAQA